MENKLDINILINNSKNPNEHPNLELKTWDDIFEFQRRLDGANYSLLVNWLKKNCNVPQIKK